MAGKKKAPVVKQPETREEWIEKYISQGYDEPDILPEPTVNFYVGQKVAIGNLIDVQVEHLHKDGRIIIISHLTEKTRDYKPPEGHRSYGKWPWWSVYPKESVLDTSFGRLKSITHSFVSGDLSGMLHSCLYFGVDDNPDFQRGYVWNDDDRARLIESVFAGRDIGKITFVKRPYPADKWVLDGKQRLNALIDYRLGRYSYKGVYYHQLSARDRHVFGSMRVQYMELDENHTSRLDMLELFLELNTSGVPIAEEHIEKVRGMYESELKGLTPES